MMGHWRLKISRYKLFCYKNDYNICFCIKGSFLNTFVLDPGPGSFISILLPTIKHVYVTYLISYLPYFCMQNDQLDIDKILSTERLVYYRKTVLHLLKRMF